MKKHLQPMFLFAKNGLSETKTLILKVVVHSKLNGLESLKVVFLGTWFGEFEFRFVQGPRLLLQLGTGF